jgi:hypothetical protein
LQGSEQGSKANVLFDEAGSQQQVQGTVADGQAILKGAQWQMAAVFRLEHLQPPRKGQAGGLLVVTFHKGIFREQVIELLGWQSPTEVADEAADKPREVELEMAGRAAFHLIGQGDLRLSIR